MAWPLLVEVDCPEPRMPKGRLMASADGTSWDLDASSADIWESPVSNTAMLAPLPTTEAWATTITGNYARWTAADYDLTTPSNWVEVPAAAGDVYLQNKGTNEIVRTSDSWEANQPFYLSLFVPGLKSMKKSVIVDAYLGYGTEGEMIFRFRADGSVELWEGGTMTWRSQRSAANLARGTNQPYQWSPSQQFVSIMIIPCRRREVEIITNYGLAASVTNLDLDVSATDNTITPAGPFAWNVPSGRATVQGAPLRFAESGTLYGRTKKLRYAPGAFVAQAFADTAGTGTGTASVSYSVAVVGLATEVRAAASLTGDGTKTPAIYAFDLQHTPDPVDTADDPVDITTAVKTLALSVAEDGRTTLAMTCHRGQLETAGVQQPTVTSDRPIRIAVGDTPVDIFRGCLSSPQIAYQEADTSYAYSLLAFEGQDRSVEFDYCTFIEALPYDGATLEAAVEDMMSLSGFDPADLFMDTNDIRLSFDPDVSLGKWAFAPERGQTVGDMLEKVRKEHCSTWITGWVPTLTGYTYQWRDPSQLTRVPALTLYTQPSHAVAAGIAMPVALSRTIREMSAHYEAPEANNIGVIGQTRTGGLIYAYGGDAASQTPDTAPADRPRNWRSRPHNAVISSPAFKEQEVVDLARDAMGDRLLVGRGLLEVTCDLLVRDTTEDGDARPIWITDCIRVMDTDGTTVRADYRVIAIPEIRFEFETSAGLSHRSATYRLLQLQPETLDLGTGGSGSGLMMI